MNCKLIGKRIKKHRKNKGLSQADLAMLTEISAYHMGSIETGVRGPSLHVLVEIALALEVTTDELLIGKKCIQKSLGSKEVSALFAECNDFEKYVLRNILHATFSILREGHHHHENMK